MTLVSFPVTPGVEFDAPKNCSFVGGAGLSPYLMIMYEKGDDYDCRYVVLELDREYKTNKSGYLVSAQTVNGVRYGLVRLEGE